MQSTGYMLNTQDQPKFSIGQRVTAIALPNGFPCPSEAKHGLIITKITLIAGHSIPDYYRYVASEPAGLGYVEGAERFFEAETCE